MTPFYVIIEDNGKFKPYDIMPYLIRTYKEIKENERPVTFDSCKEFVQKEAQYQWWARCEYEIILSNWPGENKREKWDVYKQVMMNHDLVTNIFMKNVGV